MSSFRDRVGYVTTSKECGDTHMEALQSIERLRLRFRPTLETDSHDLTRVGARHCEEYKKQYHALVDVFRERDCNESDYEVISRYDLDIHEQHICRRLDDQGHVIEQHSSVRESSHFERRVFIRRGPTAPGLHEIV